MNALYTIVIIIVILALIVVGKLYGDAMDAWTYDHVAYIVGGSAIFVIVAHVIRYWRGFRYIWDHAKRKLKQLWK